VDHYHDRMYYRFADYPDPYWQADKGTMMDGNGSSMLPMGIGLLGLSGLFAYMAFRPWPLDPASKASPQGPLSPVVYVAEILQGNPPAASNPPDRPQDVAVIEGGILALVGVWATAKLASAISSALGNTVAGGGGSDSESEDEEAGDTGISGSAIESDVEGALGTLGKDIGETGGE
jgi:hypothetical protein